VLYEGEISMDDLGAGFDWVAFCVGFAAATAMMLLLAARKRRRVHEIAEQRLPPEPITLPPDLQAQVLLLKAKGQSLDAVALVRKRTGCALKPAKDTVDALR
jgi:ribosomal protein L7/L12